MADPIKQTATSIAHGAHIELEHRMKLDLYESICRIKPDLSDGVSVENDVLTGDFFETLKPALQGIAVAKLENARFFYQKVGWNEAFLKDPVDKHLSEFQINKLQEKIQPKSLHDLSYISYKHIEKMLGKIESEEYWQNLEAINKE